MMKLYKILKKGKIVESPYPGRYAGITTRKIFGRLDCSSGKRALKKNRVFFHFWEDAVAAGYRPCKKCKPEKFTRRDCDHMPFGLNRGYAFDMIPSHGGKTKVVCRLCGKRVGFARRDWKGIIRFSYP